jgi:hypothetical protein
LKVHTWEDEDRELEKLKRRLTDGSVPANGPVAIARVWDDFISDAEARNFRDESLRKYKYLRTDMERFTETAGLRFVREFDLEQLRKVAVDLAQQKFERRQRIRVRALLSALLSRCGTDPGQPGAKIKRLRLARTPTFTSPKHCASGRTIWRLSI